MTGSFRVGDIDASPGQVSYGHVHYGYLPDGAPVSLPVILVNGSQPGPTLVLNATIRGTEIAGIEAIRLITRQMIDPSALTGRILAWPIMDPVGFRGSQDTPDTARSAGSMRAIAQDYTSTADCVIDIRSVPAPSIVHCAIAIAPDRNVRARIIEMARAVGVTAVLARQHLEGIVAPSTPAGQAVSTGRPGLAIVVSHARRMEPAVVQAAARGIYNVMAQMGMITADAIPQDTVGVFDGIHSPRQVITDRGGLVDFIKSPGDPIQGGEVFARIRDPFGDVVRDISSPDGGLILSYPLAGNQAVSTGDCVAVTISPSDQDVLAM